MSKQVKKSSVENDFYFRVFDLIKAGKNPAQICKILAITKQNLQYYTHKLSNINAVRHVGYGTWESNIEMSREEVKNLLKSSAVASTDRNKILSLSKKEKYPIRGHAFMFVLKLPKMTRWNQRREFLDKRTIAWTPIGSNWNGERIILNNFKVWLTPISIVVYFPKDYSVLSDKANKSYLHAVTIFLQKIKKIETLLDYSLAINGQYKFRPARRHFALMNNELARAYNKEGKKLFVSDEYGRWLLIDNSFCKNANGLDEIEVVNKDTSVEDMDDKVLPFFNSLKTHPTTPEFLQNTLKTLSISAIETKKEIKILSKGLIALNRHVERKNEGVSINQSDTLTERFNSLGVSPGTVDPSTWDYIG